MKEEFIMEDKREYLAVHWMNDEIPTTYYADPIQDLNMQMRANEQALYLHTICGVVIIPMTAIRMIEFVELTVKEWDELRKQLCEFKILKNDDEVRKDGKKV